MSTAFIQTLRQACPNLKFVGQTGTSIFFTARSSFYEIEINKNKSSDEFRDEFYKLLVDLTTTYTWYFSPRQREILYDGFYKYVQLHLFNSNMLHKIKLLLPKEHEVRLIEAHELLALASTISNLIRSDILELNHSQFDTLATICETLAVWYPFRDITIRGMDKILWNRGSLQPNTFQLYPVVYNF